MRPEKAQQRAPPSAIAAAISASAPSLPPLGCGSASESAMKPAPSTSRTAIAFASERSRAAIAPWGSVSGVAIARE